MFIIYKITNLINKKVYIGKTCRNITTRWNEHWSCAFNKEDNIYLHNAMRKYGKNNFQIEQIDEADTIEKLNEKEQYYIAYYHSQNKNKGYNLTNGGDGNSKYDWNEIRALWDKGYSVKEIAKILGCYRGTIGEALKDYKNYNYSLSLSRSNFNKKAICQYDKNRKLLHIYPSIISAAKAIHCSEYTIAKCLREHTNSALGYFWTYEGEELPLNIVIKEKRNKSAINQYTLDDKFIQTFDTAAEAARKIKPNGNVNSVSSSILQVCKNKRKTAYGYKWKYAK